jgi:hypothetical protein
VAVAEARRAAELVLGVDEEVAGLAPVAALALHVLLAVAVARRVVAAAADERSQGSMLRTLFSMIFTSCRQKVGEFLDGKRYDQFLLFVATVCYHFLPMVLNHTFDQ